MSERIAGFETDGLSFDVSDEGPLDGTPVVLQKMRVPTRAPDACAAAILERVGSTR